MPPARKDSPANLGCEAGVQGDFRPKTVDQVHPRAFVFRNSAFGISRADTFRSVQLPDRRADIATRLSARPKPRSHSTGLLCSERQILANPPFNDSDWFSKDDDLRWQFGVPPKGKGNPLSVNASN